MIYNRRSVSRPKSSSDDETVHYKPPGGRRRGKKGGASIEVNIAPMIDMSFLLLTFFFGDHHV